MRSGFLLLLATVVSVAGLGCPKASPYACEGNDDCALAGSDGVCLGSGSCGYPDSSCASGLAYAPGSPGELASSCVPEVGVPDSATVGTDGSSGSGSSTGAPPTSTVTSGSTSTFTGTTTGSTEDTTTSTGDTEPESCDQPDQGPNTPGDAELTGCQTELNGVLETDDPADWFALSECRSLANVVLTEDTESPLELCILTNCDTEPMCADGQSVELGGFVGCCASRIVTSQPEQGCNPTELFVGVRPDPAGVAECSDYSLSLSLM